MGRNKEYKQTTYLVVLIGRLVVQTLNSDVALVSWMFQQLFANMFPGGLGR